MLISMLISLALTLILEGLFALIWGVRGRRNWLLLLLANGVTNPLVNLFFHTVSSGWAFVALLESAAVLAEWVIYRRRGDAFRPALLFSLCANCFSFFGGILLQLVI